MEPIPEEVKRFADANIESIDQLEILRVLGETPGKEWDAAALAAAVQAEPKAVAAHLAALHGRGLLAAEKRGADWVGRYGPQTPELADQVGRLLQLYRERPVTMIKMIYARAKDSLAVFSDAFRFRQGGGLTWKGRSTSCVRRRPWPAGCCCCAATAAAGRGCCCGAASSSWR